MSEELKLLQAQVLDSEASLKALKAKVDELQLADRQKRLAPYIELATLAHEAKCPYNHTDGCAWGYEEDGKSTPIETWSYQAHRGWLQKTEEACNRGGVAISDVVSVAILYNELKNRNPKAWSAFMAIRY
jgi:hypothetical protein